VLNKAHKPNFGRKILLSLLSLSESLPAVVQDLLETLLRIDAEPAVDGLLDVLLYAGSGRSDGRPERLRKVSANDFSWDFRLTSNTEILSSLSNTMVLHDSGLRGLLCFCEDKWVASRVLLRGESLVVRVSSG